MMQVLPLDFIIKTHFKKIIEHIIFVTRHSTNFITELVRFNKFDNSVYKKNG